LKNIIEVIQKLRLPFLDESIVTIHVDCPDILSDANTVLRNVVLVNERNSITSVLQKDAINTLIDYFSEYIDLKDSLQEIRLLPLFENVTGEYEDLVSNTPYIWPNSCSIGYKTWIAGHYVIFLKPNAYYSRLGSAKQLSVSTISEQGLYNQFIFPHPHFGLMTEEDRYAHLMYIREKLFQNVFYYKNKKILKHTDGYQKEIIREAQSFFTNLITLKCIGATNAVLFPISFFCDHTQEIFCVFPDEFKLLPTELRSKEYLEFFEQLLLKHTLQPTEFIKLCNKTANGAVKDVRKASQILLEYLCNKGESYDPHTLFEISNIPFVFAERPSEVDWVLPGVTQPNQLIKLNGSALLVMKT